MTNVAAWREYSTVVLLNLTALGLIVWQLRDPRSSAVRIDPAPTRTPAPSPTPVRLHVYVSGAVSEPDVVILRAGARARDAVAAAGGFLADAERAAVNLAAPLTDGAQLHVPVKGESQLPPAGVLDNTAPARGPPSRGTNGSGATSAGAGAVNVNTASASELESLPGVGPALASRIVAHREEHGRFVSPEGLLAVTGIGEKTLARFSDMITVH